ncbi:hypothetical protein SSP531S_33890 [Streptomyces spongiicola]|uniref:Uncharacterized protein n=1 Tax=Streptomyces spongiicola TaxID=1690221 RepID=A0A388T1S1_9ACTN|nr:hypothetical protein SSP531S_33890 [Streptomyces spongiicola]
MADRDGPAVPVLTEAQSGRAPARRRTAGRCPVRAMRAAAVARGAGARPAAAVPLLLASAGVRDHLADPDGKPARGPAAAVARRRPRSGARPIPGCAAAGCGRSAPARGPARRPYRSSGESAPAGSVPAVVAPAGPRPTWADLC